MEKEYEYTVATENSPEMFRKACRIIESELRKAQKDDILTDVDGSTIQLYRIDGKEIAVYDDYDIGAVFVESDIDLGKMFGKNNMAG